MNNYKPALDYYNYKNNNFNQPTFTKNENPSAIYDPYQGFIRGNMFPDLYNSYKTNQPYALKEDAFTYMDAFAFAAHDINLYLDIYPNDKDMIAAFSEYTLQADKLMEEYQSKYGPLVVSSKTNMVYPWAWDMEPWPWEN